MTDAYTAPLFKQIQILKLQDLINFHTTMFMYKYHTKSLPLVFNYDFFTPISTRLASKPTCYLPFTRTNHGKFNITYNGVKIWNQTDNNLKNLPKKKFKEKLKQHFLKKCYYYYYYCYYCDYL